jgi:4-amino-4-deoxy-L-arabinose transferase-like glycosyltransferase
LGIPLPKFPMKRSWAWLLLLQLLLVLPFINQPLHIDDPIYLDIGRNALKSPWHPEDLPYVFEGVQHKDMASHSHPPFLGYWIGLLLSIGGDGPQVHLFLHLGFLIFPLLFAAGMFLLAIRFTALPEYATVVAITSPAAIVMAHTVMTDVPTLALSTLGLALYVTGIDKGKPLRVWLSGILLALAAFSSYPALLISALCWLYAWRSRQRMRAAVWAPAIAWIWMGAWLVNDYAYFGRFVIGGTAQYVLQTGGWSAANFGNKLLAFPIFLAATVVILPVTLFRLALRLPVRWAALLWMVLSVVFAQLNTADYSLLQKTLVALFLTLGGWIILGVLVRIARSWRDRDTAFLAIWFVIAIVPLVFAYTSGMARYLLPLVPPIVLLAFQKSSEMALPGWKRAAVLSSSVGLALGLVLSIADFDMAQIDRNIAESTAARLNGWTAQTRFGAEWGLRHYMLQEGFRQFLSTSSDLSGGTFLISPTEAVPYAVPQDVLTMLVPAFQETWRSSLPIRLMNRTAHAGFYSSNWGLLPFSFSRAPVESIDVKQVSYLVEKLPEIEFDEPDEGVLIPVPAPDGGVDLIVPVPGVLRIPYSGPLPVHVRFSCIGNGTEDCPVRVSYDPAGGAQEVTLSRDKDVWTFDLNSPSPGKIVLTVAAKTVLRNWLMLPLR